MVIEHSFVTTLESPQAMQAAMQLLGAHGFVLANQSAFPMGQQWDTLEMRRGKPKAARAKNIVELPQTAHVQWDRGRVTVVLTIEPSATWGGQSSIGVSFGTASPSPKKMKLHTQLLAAIATALDQVLAHGVSPEMASQQWIEIEEESRRIARRRRTRALIIVGVFVALCAALVTLAVTVK